VSKSIELSLVSHTNAGKTTLARSLLGRDIGEVRDEAHVTMQSDRYLLVSTAQGDEVGLWDTPGFGDSQRIARRLELSDNPIGWLLTQVWDRYRDRALFASQQAVRNVRERSDVVLYLVNAAEDPQDASYVQPEMRVLEWIGKPVIVLLNQLGRPRPGEQEHAEIERWREQLAGVRCVRAVLALDAFARCWVQEVALLSQIAAVLADGEKRAAFSRLQTEWLQQRQATFEESVTLLAQRVARAAADTEQVADSGWTERIRELSTMLGMREDGEQPRKLAMSRLADRLDADIRTGTDGLIALHGLSGHAGKEIVSRLAEHYAISEHLSEGKAAVLGGLVSGALAGLKADLATGGLSFGAGLLAGGVLGALGAAGIARGYNLVRGTNTTNIAWSDEVLDRLVASALLGYLAVAHYGRGRGEWSESEHPAHWVSLVDTLIAEQRAQWSAIWALRHRTDADTLTMHVHQTMMLAATQLLRRLYPDTEVPADAGASTPDAAFTSDRPD
jgi:hypothetical protein